MTRLPRILLNAATAVSLVLCVATAILWALTHRTGMALSRFPYFPERRIFEWRVVMSDPEGLFLQYRRHRIIDEELAEGTRRAHASGTYQENWRFGRGDTAGIRPNPLTAHERAGFRFRWTRNHLAATGTHLEDGLEVGLPHWFAVALCSILPARAAIRRLRRPVGAVPGRCRSCGYDLRATPARCPECGAVPLPPPPLA